MSTGLFYRKNISKFLGIFLFALLAPMVSRADDVVISRTWITRTNIDQRDFVGSKLLRVDQFGNVFVAGYVNSVDGNRDFLIAKYDSNGNRLWWKRYDNGGYDVVNDMVVDAQGNIFITGPSSRDGTYGELDFATIKYSSDGTQLWVARFGGTDWYSSNALALDTRGNVYVTGRGRSPIVTVKYDSNGNQIWAFSIGDGAEGKVIATDVYDNVYVGGYARGINGQPNFLVVKYDVNGAILWTTQYSGDRGSVMTAMSVDALQNVYVTGFADLIDGHGSDFVTIKYNANGSQEWIQGFDGGDTSGDFPSSLVLDGGGNVVVSGYGWIMKDSGNKDMDVVTIKYDANGNQLWAARENYGSNEISEDLAVDSSGNIYVIASNSWGVFDFILIKYNLNGTKLWSERYDSGGLDFAQAIEVDGAGNIYAAGAIIDNPYLDWDLLVIKYSQLPDVDGDGTANISDNCLSVYNPDQSDIDGDGVGDACDADDDNDSILDSSDNCQYVANADQIDTDGDGLGDVCETDNTLTGQNVMTTIDYGISVTFTDVSATGNTIALVGGDIPIPPAGFQLGDPPAYYDISTTALFSAPIVVCVSYDPAQFSDPSIAQLFHYENGAWTDITISNDTSSFIVCGQSNSLSPFAIFQPTPTKLIGNLIDLVKSYNLRQGIENSLDVKLQRAQEALGAAQTQNQSTVCNALAAFINEAQAQSGRALTADQANELVFRAQKIKNILGCI